MRQNTTATSSSKLRLQTSKLSSTCVLSDYITLHTFLTAPFSGTTQVSQYQRGKISLDFTEARDSEWQWHQLGHMQVCTLLQIDNHARTPPLRFYRPGALPAAQPTASKHRRHYINFLFFIGVLLLTLTAAGIQKQGLC